MQLVYISLLSTHCHGYYHYVCGYFSLTHWLTYGELLMCAGSCSLIDAKLCGPHLQAINHNLPGLFFLQLLFAIVFTIVFFLKVSYLRSKVQKAVDCLMAGFIMEFLFTLELLFMYLFIFIALNCGIPKCRMLLLI